MDLVKNRVRELLEAQGDSDSSGLAANIAFLVRNAVGPEVKPDQISITFGDVYDEDGTPWAWKITVAVHLGPGELKVVVCKTVEGGDDIMQALETKVNKAIEKVLQENGGNPFPSP